MSISDLSKDSDASKLSNFSIEPAAPLLLSESTACWEQKEEEDIDNQFTRKF